MESEDLIDKCRAIIVGCAVGDCIGIPFETMKYEEIHKIEERNSAPYLKASAYWSDYFVKKLEGKEFGPGMHTDDTQLTSAVCRAFSRLNPEEDDFHGLMTKMVEEHVAELDKPPCDYGISTPITWGGTVSALQRLKNFSHTYKDSGNNMTVGNGVLMKSVPLAFFYSFANQNKMKKIDLSDQTAQIAIYNDMTHETPQHRVSANVFMDFLVSLMRSNGSVLESIETKKKLLVELIEKSKLYEDEIFKQVVVKPENVVIKRKKYLTQYERMSDYLKKLHDLLTYKDGGKFCGLDDHTLLEISHGGTHVNIYSLTMVIGLCMSLEKGVDGMDIEFIKRSAFIGGDTDTNAAMIGAICGAMKGLKMFPKEYCDGLIYFKQIVKDGEEFGKFMCSVV